MEALTEALAAAIEAQMRTGVTTFIEVVLNQELGEPFRRDAMKKPVVVAGIDAGDMRPQQPSEGCRPCRRPFRGRPVHRRPAEARPEAATFFRLSRRCRLPPGKHV